MGRRRQRLAVPLAQPDELSKQECSIDERWQALRFVYRLEDRSR
ncbi:MAG TPA: hypothetical protein VLA69_01545 [Gaiellaceae bacterium]|nr:hypothetical protein [Gaiellaceae bacterium]